MRKYIDIINEAMKPTKTKSGDLESIRPSLTPDVSSPSSMTTMSGDQTRKALANATMPTDLDAGGIIRDLANFTGDDEITDAQARANAGTGMGVGNGYTHAEPRTPKNLPAVIQQALLRQEEYTINQTFDPTWHQIKHLPGYIQNGIRQIGRAVFRQFTNTPIEDIQMMCDILDRPIDVKKMASWIVRNGVRQTEAAIDFEEMLPGYSAIAGVAECTLWNAEGYQFLIMRDRGGNYIYGWPADEDRMGDRSETDDGALPPPMRRLN